MKYKLILDKGKMYALVRANAYGRDHTRMPSFPVFKRCMFERIGSGYQLYGDSFMASLYWRSGLLHLDIIDILWYMDSQVTWEPEAFPYFKWCLIPLDDNNNDEP